MGGKPRHPLAQSRHASASASSPWTMNAAGARFITITAYQLPGDEGFRLEYHWDLEGRLLGFPFHHRRQQPIESIYDLCEAADWIEREVHEGFAIDFTGREYEPLLLRAGDKPGVNLRESQRPASPLPTRRGKRRSQNELQNPHGALPSRPRRTLQARHDLRRRNRHATPSCTSASTSAASSTWPKRATTSRSSRSWSASAASAPSSTRSRSARPWKS